MKIKSSDILGILSLYFVTAVLGEEQHGEQPKQDSEQHNKKDPMTLIKDSQ